MSFTDFVWPEYVRKSSRWWYTSHNAIFESAEAERSRCPLPGKNRTWVIDFVWYLYVWTSFLGMKFLKSPRSPVSLMSRSAKIRQSHGVKHKDTGDIPLGICI